MGVPIIDQPRGPLGSRSSFSEGGTVKQRLTYSNIVATIALVLAVGGGASAWGGTSTISATARTVQVYSRTVDVPTNNANAVTILKTKGLGVLSEVGGSSCTQAPGMVTAQLVWRNLTTTPQRISFEREGSTTSSDVAPGATGTVDLMVRYTSADIFQGQLLVSGYKGMHAVMDISVAIGGPAGQHCHVSVVATVSS